MNNKIKWLITIATLVISLVLLIVSLSDGYNRTADYDDMYGGDCTDIHRQALHCSHLSVKHPVTDEQMEFDSPLPEDISSLIY